MAYTLTGRKGGTVRFEPWQNGLVEKESESYSSTVTSNPVENGAVINDHVNNAAGQLTISGVIIGGESAINALKSMRESRDLITYTGISRMNNLVFTSLKFDRSYKNQGGASFSATLKQIQNGETEYMAPDTPETMSSMDAERAYNAQMARTIAAGMKTVAVQTLSSASAARYRDAYGGSYNMAPLTRVTGAYDGLSY